MTCDGSHRPSTSAAESAPIAAAGAGDDEAVQARPAPRAPRPAEPAITSATALSAVRWNSIAVAGRQAFLLVSAVVLARVLGPETYGVIGAATIYVTFTTLLLDQGLASALIQRPHLSRWAGGAAASANIATGVLLAGVTWVSAPAVADFFSSEPLAEILRLLGVGLVVKSLAIAPRALQSRRLAFRRIAQADVLGALLGSVAGIAGALLGAGAASIVLQVVVMDAVAALILCTAPGAPRPNLRFREVLDLLPYGTRVMTTNGIAFFARNADNILVARFLGVEALSYYAMAYRVLVIPVQLLGQTVARVMFPVFSRLADRRDLLAENLLKATGLLAFVTVPTMTLLAVASSDIIRLVLGTEWLPAAAVLTVLALAGARETVFYVSGPLMKATGEVALLLRYEVLATVVQVAGIVVGLRFGIVGVAVGYAAAGIALTPLLLWIQKRLSGASVRAQLRAIGPSVHAAAWAAAAYLVVAQGDHSALVTLLLGSCAAVVAAVAVLGLAHRRSSRVHLGRIRRALGRRAPLVQRDRPAASS